MRYFHRRTLSGALMHFRWGFRKFRKHLIHHRHKYVSGGMIHIALVVFVGDAAAAALPLPHAIVVIIHTQKTWAVPIAAAIGHLGFMLERAADKQKAEDKMAKAVALAKAGR